MSHDENKIKIRKLAYMGVLAALIFVGTMIHVPTAIGHVNLGDMVILVSSYLLGPVASIPAAIGSAAADIIAGYVPYALPTFLIKGVMGLVAGLIMKRNSENKVHLPRRIIAAIVAEIIMIAGYFAFESLPFMYGVAAAIGSVIPNLSQAGAALILAIPLTYVKVFDRVHV